MKASEIITVVKDKVQTISIAQIIYNHLVDEKHSVIHKMLCGAFIMIAGVVISKSGTGVYHYFTDMVGYGVHGFGLVPFIDKILKR